MKIYRNIKNISDNDIIETNELKRVFDSWVLDLDIKNGTGHRPDLDSLLYAWKYTIDEIKLL